jgi:hypothetical protein
VIVVNVSCYFFIFYDEEELAAYDGRCTGVMWGTTCELFISKVKFRKNVLLYTSPFLPDLTHFGKRASAIYVVGQPP